MKRVAIMQPYLFPYIGYFQLMKAADHFVFLDDVNYINRGWVNRNRILVNGKEHMFTLPLLQASQNRKINEIELSDDSGWQQKFFRTIDMAYSKAPNFDKCSEYIRQTFKCQNQNLSGFIIESFRLFYNSIGCEFNFSCSSQSDIESNLHGQDKIIAICKSLGATHYINPPGGRHLYSSDIFSNNNIQLEFLSPILTHYKQRAPEFVPGLSIIDVMMNNDSEWLIDNIKKFEISG